MTSATSPSSCPAVSAPSLQADFSEPAVARGDPKAGMGLLRPTSQSLVIWARGELDSQRSPYWSELVLPRMSSAVDAIVLDLAAVRFLGVDALSVLLTAHHQAHSRGVDFCLVTGASTAVHRALRAAGAQRRVVTYRSRAEALAPKSSC